MTREEFIKQMLVEDKKCYPELAEARADCVEAHERLVDLAGFEEARSSIRSLAISVAQANANPAERSTVEHFTKKGRDVVAAYHGLVILRELRFLSGKDAELALLVAQTAQAAIEMGRLLFSDADEEVPN